MNPQQSRRQYRKSHREKEEIPRDLAVNPQREPLPCFALIRMRYHTTILADEIRKIFT
jgi:hypothetical protein